MYVYTKKENAAWEHPQLMHIKFSARCTENYPTLRKCFVCYLGYIGHPYFASQSDHRHPI